MAYIFAADSMGLSSFIFCDGLRKTHLFWKRMRYGRSRSSKVVDFGTNRKGVCDFLLVINSNFGSVLHVFWDMESYWLKIANFSYPPLFDAPVRGGTLSNFWMKLIEQKLEMGLLYGENCTILTTTVFAWITRVTDRRTDGQTDGIAIAYTRLQHICCRAQKPLMRYSDIL